MYVGLATTSSLVRLGTTSPLSYPTHRYTRIFLAFNKGHALNEGRSYTNSSLLYIQFCLKESEKL